MTEPIYKIGDVLYDEKRKMKLLIIICNYVGDYTGYCASNYEYRCVSFIRELDNTIATFQWRSEESLVKSVKRLGNIDMSLIINNWDEKKKWEVTDEDLPDILNELTKVGLKVSYREQNEDGLRVTCEAIKQAKEVEKAWNEKVEKEKKKIEKVWWDKAEFDAMKKELEELRKQKDDKAETLAKIQHAWKDGWYECLKTFKYYLGTDEANEDRE